MLVRSSSGPNPLPAGGTVLAEHLGRWFVPWLTMHRILGCFKLGIALHWLLQWLHMILPDWTTWCLGWFRRQCLAFLVVSPMGNWHTVCWTFEWLLLCPNPFWLLMRWVTSCIMTHAVGTRSVIWLNSVQEWEAWVRVWWVWDFALSLLVTKTHLCLTCTELSPM